MRSKEMGKRSEDFTSVGGWRELKAALNVEPPTRRTLFVTALLGALTVTFAVIGALALREVVNHGVYAGFPEAIGALTLAALSPTLAVATGWLLVARAERVGFRASARLTERAFAHLQHVRMEVLDAMRSGELTARLIDDPTELAERARWASGTGLFTLAFGLATVISTAIINWRLLGLVAIVTPLFLVLTHRFSFGMRRLASYERLATQADLAAVAQERFSGVRLVQASRAEGRETARLAALAERLSHEHLREFLAGRTSGDIGIALSWFIAPVLVFGFGSFEYLNGRITVGDIAALMTLLLALVKIGMTAEINYFEFGSVFAAARRLNETLNLPTEDDLGRARVTLAQPPSVELDGVAFRHRSTDVQPLADVDMLAEAGKVIALGWRERFGQVNHRRADRSLLRCRCR